MKKLTEKDMHELTDNIMGNVIPTLKGNMWAGKMTEVIPSDDPHWNKAYEGEYADLWVAIYNAVHNKFTRGHGRPTIKGGQYE